MRIGGADVTLPLPPKPDRQISRIRLSSSWLPMGWLRLQRRGAQRPPASRASFRFAHPRSTPSALGALFRSGFALALASSPAPPAESSSLGGRTTATALRPGRSRPVALHPGLLPRCSYVPILAFQCRPGQGLSPCCQRALSGALGQASSLPVFGASCPKFLEGRGD